MTTVRLAHYFLWAVLLLATGCSSSSDSQEGVGALRDLLEDTGSDVHGTAFAQREFELVDRGTVFRAAVNEEHAVLLRLQAFTDSADQVVVLASLGEYHRTSRPFNVGECTHSAYGLIEESDDGYRIVRNEFPSIDNVQFNVTLACSQGDPELGDFLAEQWFRVERTSDADITIRTSTDETPVFTVLET